MTMQSTVTKALLIIFALIGLVVVVGAIAMAFMHGSMMGMMGGTFGMQDGQQLAQLDQRLPGNALPAYLEQAPR